MRHMYWAGILFLGAGCAGGALVNQRTQSSMEAIRAAEVVGVVQAPKASLHLDMAKDAVERAKKLSSDGKQSEAASLLLRAEADAELAALLSREQTEKTQAAEAIERVRKLQQENL